MTEVAIAMIVAWWVGVYHMVVGGYLVFISERRTPLLLVTGVVKGLLGAAIYLVIRQPLWVSAHTPTLPDVIVPVTLLILLVFSIIVTRIIWAAFDLDSPQDRVIELAHCVTEWGERQWRRFGK